MLKRILAIAAMVCALPALANAVPATVKTWAQTPGGYIETSLNAGFKQTSAYGAKFYNFSTPAATNPTVTVTAQPGYVATETASGLCSGTAGSYTCSGSGEVVAYFEYAPTMAVVTATAGTGGSVNIKALKNLYIGQTLLNSIKFVFQPKAGGSVNAITLTVGGSAVAIPNAQILVTGGTPSNPAKTVTFLAGYPVTGNIALAATFSAPAGGDAPVACAPKTMIIGDPMPTLTATPAGGAWSRQGGPSVYDAVLLKNVPVGAISTAGVTSGLTSAGLYYFKYTVNGTYATTSVNVYATAAEAAAASCVGCHDANGVGAGISTTFPTSIHGVNIVACADCHAGANTAGHPGVPQCTPCHTNVAPVYSNACASCHIGTTIHAAQVTTEASCIGCHDVAIAHPGNVVNDNNGVRAITPEFAKNSHHVTGRTVTDADCAACHLEGKLSGGVIVVDTAYHMKDANTYLRNGGGVAAYTDAAFVWNPASPNHTTMDKFCMSCHNANGAPAAAAVTGATAANPFGSSLTNGYDTLVRPAVVPVYEQFDPTNVAHHAVRGAKYSVRTRTAAFANNSSAASPGVRKTIYDAGLFVAAYTPLGATLSVADNSVLHCGDCHTVGQFKPGSTTNDKGVATTQAIGAHGSVNEYMLRNASGVDALHHQSNNASATAGPVDGTYVCFLCHAQTEEETGGYNAMGFHGGMEGANTSYCNGRAAESVGLTGFGGSFKTTYDANGVKIGQTRVPNLVGTNAGGVVFGYSCAGCHNAGENNTFGGIHGGNATYKSYSSNGSPASATNAGFTIVQAKPYRFMGGLSLKYNGGNSAKWEAKALTRANREGCYNQSTVADNTTPPNNKVKLWGTAGALDVNGVADDIAVNPNAGGANGTWGSCSHHNGALTTGAGTGPTRVGVQRPLSY